jgi:Plasmid pRiA4b ORF-3-like protein
MAATDEIAVLRIELDGIEPLIWRRVGVRAEISLADLHRVIQAVMGWLNSHLWEFEIDGRKYGPCLPGEPDWNERIANAETVTLGTVLHAGERTMQYVYDMGDSWEHSIIVERLKAPLPEVRYPQFLGGERRCPPEDCGGVPGYYEFLKNVTSERKDKRTHALLWYGRPYDAGDIEEQKITTALRQLG